MDEIRRSGPIDQHDPAAQVALAQDILRRLPAAAQPLLDLFDECIQHGMVLQFDTIGYAPHVGRHLIDKARVVKVMA